MSKVSTKQTGKQDMFKQDDVLQAVIIADNFSSKFDPVSENLPVCLFPLAGVPLIHYIISQLIESGIQEIIIFCSSFPDKVRKFVKQKHYSNKIVIKVIAGEATHSLGDAMRDIDTQRLIHSDFILIQGDLVTNVDFKKLLLAHKQCRTKDSTSVMTSVWYQNSQLKEPDAIIGYTQQDMKLKFLINAPKRGVLRVDLDKLMAGVDLRCDLVDVGISICSIVIPPLFQDNFDYDTIEDLVTGVITNEEILNNSIHIEIIREFAGRVTDMFQYERLTETVLKRRVHPLQPTLLAGIQPSGGLPNSSTLYISSRAEVDRSTQCGNSTLIGVNTKVGKNCRLESCIVGDNCHIGDNVVLKKAFLWDNVTVENDCNIVRSLLCSNTVVKSCSIIEERSVLNHSVVVGPKANLESNSVLVSERGDTLKSSIIGNEGKAFRYHRGKDKEGNNEFGYDSEDSGEDDIPGIWADAKAKMVHSESVDDKAKEDDDQDCEEDTEPKDAETLCLEEVRITLERGLKEKVSSDNTILEVNSLKHAYNIPIEDLYFLVSKAFIEFPLKFSSLKSDTSAEYYSSIQHMVTTLPHVLTRYVENDRAARLCLQAIEETACENDVVMDSLMKVMYLLYEKDIMTEEAIMWWYHKSPLLSDDDLSVKTKLVRDKLAPFITWLQEAEEESD